MINTVIKTSEKKIQRLTTIELYEIYKRIKKNIVPENCTVQLMLKIIIFLL